MAKKGSVRRRITDFIKVLGRAATVRKIASTRSKPKNIVLCPFLLGLITKHAPNLSLKSNSASAALEAYTKYIFRTKISNDDALAFLKALNVAVPALYTADGGAAQKAFMARVRTVIKSTYGAKHLITTSADTIMRYDQAAAAREAKEYKKKIAKKNKNRDVFDDDVVYAALDKAARADDWPTLAIGIEGALGGRINEILSASNFEAVPDRPNYIRQLHLSKKKEIKYRPGMSAKQFARLKKQYDDSTVRDLMKPVVHLSVQTVLAMIAEVRRQLKADVDRVSRGELTSAELSKKYNARVNKAAKKLIPGTTSHGWRKIYAALSWRLFGSMSKSSEAGWFSDVLGHAKDSLAVASSYTTTGIRSAAVPHSQVETKIADVRSTNEDLDKKVQELTDKLEALNIQLNKKAAAGATINIKETLVNIPRNVRAKDGRALQRLAVSVAALEAKGIKPTTRILRQLSFGSRTINQFRKARKAATATPPKPAAKPKPKAKTAPRRSGRLAKK